MQFVWAGDRHLKNTKLVFTIKTEIECDSLSICAVDFYRVFVDDILVAFGPARTAAGFSRVKKIKLNGQKNIKIEVLAYNEYSFACDKQLPFFGATLEKGEKTVYSTTDFLCSCEVAFDRKTPRYSSQRGFVEKYDLTKTAIEKLTTYIVDAPKIINELEDYCDYSQISFEHISDSVFYGSDNYAEPEWMNRKEFKLEEGAFSIENDFIKELKKGYFCKDFCLKNCE